MKKLALALSAVAAFTGSAIAADLPARPYTKAAPVAYVPPPTWTGCYIGGGGGYGLWNQENTLFADPRPPSNVLLRDLVIGDPTRRRQLAATETSGGRGWFGTVQGGCDYQFAAAGQQFVIGAQADYDFMSLKGHVNVPTTNFTGDEKQNDAWSVGGRIGWLAFPQLLTYFSAGYTQAHFSGTTFLNFRNSDAVFLNSRTYDGWYLGAGDEYALTFMPGLFWKTEYRVSEYKKKTNPFYDADGPIFASFDSKKWVQTVRSELVYRFNWGGPVVAKY
jgi:outer membrane immunogenic protein